MWHVHPLVDVLVDVLLVVAVRVRVRVHRHIFDSIETIRTRSAFPSRASSSATFPLAWHTSNSAPHSIAEPRAIALNLARSGPLGFPAPSAMFRGTDRAARLSWLRSSASPRGRLETTRSASRRNWRASW